jgi:hypothetical protein
VLAISVVSARHRSRAGRTTTLIAGHRTLWDQVGLLTQLHAAACPPAVSRTFHRCELALSTCSIGQLGLMDRTTHPGGWAVTTRTRLWRR